MSGRPFAAGVSGNPGWRPHGLGSYIRVQTANGRECVALMLAILRGEKLAGRRPTLRDRVAAATWLMDRGFGKPALAVDVEVTNATNFGQLSGAELNAQIEERLAELAADGIHFVRFDHERFLEANPDLVAAADVVATSGATRDPKPER